MVDVLVILDGASEPPRPGLPTCLGLARTPALDRLAREGSLARLRTVAAGLAPGSEVAIPALLGWMPPGPVDRGALEAAALGVEVGAGERAWRVDVAAAEDGVLGRGRGATAGQDAIGAAAQAARGAVLTRGHGATPGQDRIAAALRRGAPRHRLHALGGRRLLLVGPPPLPAAARAEGLRVWPEGIVPPRVLDAGTVLVGARGAAVGAARLMGAGTIVPCGATGAPDSDLGAKLAAALGAIAAGAVRVVVHVGGPDEAAHRRDRAGKVEILERADRELAGPLAAAVEVAGGSLRVCPDHGCDPATGRHDGEPVPCVTWSPGAGAGRPAADGRSAAWRLTERAVAHLPVTRVSATPALVEA